MNDADIAVLLRDGMLVMLKLGGPPLLVALGVGLLTALLQRSHRSMRRRSPSCQRSSHSVLH
jgi:flagellar biosynthesis protein FliQ